MPGHGVSSYARFIIFAIPSGGEFLGGEGKACSSITNKGAGIVVAVGPAARQIFIVVVSGCEPTVVLDRPPALKFPVFLNRILPFWPDGS